MAAEKYICFEEAVKIVFNDDSGNGLIPELESSESGGYIIICEDVHVSEMLLYGMQY